MGRTQLRKAIDRGGASRFLPLKGRRSADFLASLSLLIILIPQAMAQASLAQLPAVYGLYTAAAALIAGGLFGHLHRFSAGPTSLIAITVAMVIGEFAGSGTDSYLMLVMLLSLLVGGMRLMFGLFRFSFFANLISQPAASGFTSAAAVLIIVSQIQTYELTHLPTLVLGCSFIAVNLLLKRKISSVPALIIPLAISIAVSWLTGFGQSGGELLGAVQVEIPSINLFSIEEGIQGLIPMTVEILPGALVVTLVGLMEMVAISSHLTQTSEQGMNLDRELFAQGLGSMWAGMVGSFPPGASFARSALLEHQHVSSRFSNFIAGVMVVPAALFLSPLLSVIPRVVMGGIIIVSVSGVIRLASLRHAWKSSWLDALVWASAFVSTIAFAPRIHFGIMIPVILQLTIFVLRRMRPRIIILGRHPDGRLRDAELFHLPLPDHIIAFRMDSSLHFANRQFFLQQIIGEIKLQPLLKHCIISAEGIHYVDESGVQALSELHDYCVSRDIRLWIAGVKLPALKVLRQRGLLPGEEDPNRETGILYAGDVSDALEGAYTEILSRGIVEKVDLR